MKIESTPLAGVKRITLDVFKDHRGTYIEIYNEAVYKEKFGVDWVTDDISVSKRNVLRGIHGDHKTYKLVSCAYGKLLLYVVDCREKSVNFGKWCVFMLTGSNGVQIFVPPNRGIAHLVISGWAVFNYKQSTYYETQHQFTYRYDDPRFGIRYPIKDLILSDRDMKGGDG